MRRRTSGYRLTEALWERSGLAGPAIVLGFGSTPYVPILLGKGAKARALDAAVQQAVSAFGQTGDEIAIRPFFPAISDVSFFGESDPAGFSAVAANTPFWTAVLATAGSPPSANLPTINVGPWGRDYHGRTERLEMDYAFRVLPRLLLDICRRLLSAG